MTEMSFEERLMAAVVEKFFAPEWMVQGAWNPNTQQTEQQMVQYQSAASRVASEVFQAHKQEILTKVLDRLDLDALAEAMWPKISAALVERLTPTRAYDSYKPEKEALRAKVNELVAAELARRTLERMDQADA